MKVEHDLIEDVSQRAINLTPNGILMFFHEGVQYKIARVKDKNQYILARMPLTLTSNAHFTSDLSPENIQNLINSYAIEDVHGT